MVLCDRGCGWWYGGYDSLLECLDAVRFFVFSPGALGELSFGDQHAAALWLDQSSGSICMSTLMLWSEVVSAPTSWEIVCGCCGGLVIVGVRLEVCWERSFSENV